MIGSGVRNRRYTVKNIATVVRVQLECNWLIIRQLYFDSFLASSRLQLCYADHPRTE